MRKEFVEKTFKKMMSMPPMDTVYILPEEREFTLEEWDYYEELIREHGRAVAEGKIKPREYDFVITNIGMVEKMTVSELQKFSDPKFLKRYRNDRVFRKKFIKRIEKRYKRQQRENR